MLTQHRCAVSLSFVSTDLPIWSGTETAATLYQKDRERFDLVLTEPVVVDRGSPVEQRSTPTTPRLLWLELSPYRVIMTMQEAQFSYRHFWEQGVYGPSRYWLHSHPQPSDSFCLRNFTRRLTLQGRPLPIALRVEYELWSEKLPLGRYVLNLEMQPAV